MFTLPLIVKSCRWAFKLAGYADAEKLRHECLRDDRPSHGRDVRALMDEFTACR